MDRILEFDGNGHICQYEGGYTDYLSAKGQSGRAQSGSPEKRAENTEKKANKDWKQNRSTKLKFTYKEQREFETIDEDITALEEKIAHLDEEIMKNATNSGKLNELTQERKRLKRSWKKKWTAGCI